MPGEQEPKEKKRKRKEKKALLAVQVWLLDGYRLNECLIVAEHNLVSNVSTAQVAEEAKLSDCSLDEASEVGEGRGEEITTSQSSASMQVLANVVVL